MTPDVSEFEITCVAECGFRVDDGYYARKRKFQPTACARCSSPIKLVERGTNNILPWSTLSATGRVVHEEPPAGLDRMGRARTEDPV